MGEMADLMAALQKTPYHHWMKAEGVPVAEGYGIEDVRELQLAPWPRMGGRGSFIHLYGMEGLTGMYVAEIPPGDALKPEKHLYEEVICVLSGQGAMEVWQDERKKQTFEWEPWSLFSPPLNGWHRMINGGREPVRFLAVTTAPLVMDIFHSAEFIFDCPQAFSDRYRAEEGYFSVGQKQYTVGMQSIWETNFIPNVKEFNIKDEFFTKGPDIKLVQFEPCGNILVGHVADWPVGLYHKAHYHDAGAVLMILRSQGYTLLWPMDAGIRPYENGRGGEVVEVKWSEGAVLSPPGGWFHQHFNAGAEAARQLAIRYGSRIHRTGFHLAAQKKTDGVYISVKDGGTMIEYEDEDPEIRRQYEAALKKNAVPCKMPPVKYSR
ncbi:MAG: cupin domain-containing protein [Deltaproteobacteria bacterium]|nr:cupin domain-containing protein [Deltaproteobacteria bacterium]